MAVGGDMTVDGQYHLKNLTEEDRCLLYDSRGIQTNCSRHTDGISSSRGSSSYSEGELTEEDEQVKPDIFQNLSHWVSCICIVTFDLELGQAIETVYPETFKLSDTEKTNICYLAFPDSNSGCMGDTQYHIKIRASGPGAGGTSFNHMRDHNGAPLVLTPSEAYYYGFVYFRQVKDSDIKRGYFQKSVVILTRLPYITFFTYLIEKLAPDYFKNGLASLEAACHNINKWPSPRPGELLQLPLLGQLLYVRIPHKSDKPDAISAMMPDSVGKSSSMMVIPSVHELNLYQALQPVLSRFETIWELILLNEPLVIMSSSPTLCANTVQALVSLIYPLCYSTDYRPYFTIHDTEFKYYTTRTQAPPQVILGVTNPFFSKTLDHWPHIIRITDQNQDEARQSNNTMSSSRRKMTEVGDSRPGVYTRYKPHISKDKLFIKLLQTKPSTVGKRPMEVQNALIRKHALELTTNFIIPLERYLASLMPLKRDVSPWKPPPVLRDFDEEQFLKMAEGAGPQMISGIKGNWIPLYKRFLQSPNFKSWYMIRREEANQKLRLIHLEMLCKADVFFWMKDKQEIEIVDFLLQVKQCTNVAIVHQPPVSTQTLQTLKRLVQSIIQKLPEDLQSCLKTTFGT